MDIEIPRELADAEGVPEDLDANVVGPYRFPNSRRRRASGWIYAAAAAVAAVAAGSGLARGLWWVAGALLALGAYHVWAAHDVRLSESDAFDAAARAIDHPVGHASAALRFEGFRSLPVWNVVVYDAAEPPRTRSLVQVDARSGDLRRPVYAESWDAQRSDIGT